MLTRYHLLRGEVFIVNSSVAIPEAEHQLGAVLEDERELVAIPEAEHQLGVKSHPPWDYFCVRLMFDLCPFGAETR